MLYPTQELAGRSNYQRGICNQQPFRGSSPSRRARGRGRAFFFFGRGHGGNNSNAYTNTRGGAISPLCIIKIELLPLNQYHRVHH